MTWWEMNYILWCVVHFGLMFFHVNTDIHVNLKARTQSLSFLEHNILEHLYGTPKNCHLSSINLFILIIFYGFTGPAGYIEGLVKKSIFAYTQWPFRRKWSGRSFSAKALSFQKLKKVKIDFSCFCMSLQMPSQCSARCIVCFSYEVVILITTFCFSPERSLCTCSWASAS